MGKAVYIHKTGGVEVLKWEDHDPGPPAAGQVRVRHEFVGLNFIDIYHRRGLYPLPQLPWILGQEGAGVVEEVGPEVTGFRSGDRVAYASGPPGAYAQDRLMPANRLVKLPEGISTELAAATMLKGMTARYLLHGCYPVKAGDTILIHAAAGGVGSIVCQWAHHLGARVIGTVGSEAKAAYAAGHGCDFPILYRQEDFAAKVKQLTSGEGVNVVYDSVGQATFMKSLDCLRPLGTMVSFGQSSGPIAPFDLSVLAAKGSLFLTRPTLMTYTAKQRDLVAHAEDLFEMLLKDAVRVEINQRYALADAALAHTEMESRRTTGASVLVP
ncbi:MAG: quinone oxidoreductase [Desulfobacteraceae bacterium]|nr:MAG: quinone oxidoreductase [Desulfobacteraceae bacterium]